MSYLRNVGKKCCLGIAIGAMLIGCRGEDNQVLIDPDVLDFIKTPDPDRFNLFLNHHLGETANNILAEANYEKFPEAYYRSIDPNNTRATLDGWLTENGFRTDHSFTNEDHCTLETDSDGDGIADEPECCIVTARDPEPAASCDIVMAHVSFRDTRDLGYGRDMYLRHEIDTGQVAVYVRNFRIDGIEGLPYGSLNLEALVRERTHGQAHGQFGVNAIEFSTYPYGVGEPSNGDVVDSERVRAFAKIFTFLGDDFDATADIPGMRLNDVDLDSRPSTDTINMPTPCIVCHGGHGRTTVLNIDDGGIPVLEPTMHNGLAGDVQMHMQPIDVNSLQFANLDGYTQDDNEAGLRAINNAVLSTYLTTLNWLDEAGLDTTSAYWDPSTAIDLIKGRYALQDNDKPFHPGSNRLKGPYKKEYIPDGWIGENPEAFTNFVAPNCLVCHALRGSNINPTLSFGSSSEFQAYADRIDQLVFDQGLMPLGLWNFRQFWDLKEPLPLADMLGLSHRIENGEIIKPGRPVARLSAPFNANPSADSVIHVSAAGSAFANLFQWTVGPSGDLSCRETSDAVWADCSNLSDSSDKIQIRVDNQTNFDEITVAVEVSSENYACTETAPGCSASAVIVLDALQPSNPTYFGAGGVAELLSSSEVPRQNCTSCHYEEPSTTDPQSVVGPRNPGLPVVYCSHRESPEELYRGVLARVNLNRPLDSLILRKPTNGATSLEDVVASQVLGYHGGNLILTDKSEISRLVSWINAGAQPGPYPDSFTCN